MYTGRVTRNERPPRGTLSTDQVCQKIGIGRVTLQYLREFMRLEPVKVIRHGRWSNYYTPKQVAALLRARKGA